MVQTALLELLLRRPLGLEFGKVFCLQVPFDFFLHFFSDPDCLVAYV